VKIPVEKPAKKLLLSEEGGGEDSEGACWAEENFYSCCGGSERGLGSRTSVNELGKGCREQGGGKRLTGLLGDWRGYLRVVPCSWGGANGEEAVVKFLGFGRIGLAHFSYDVVFILA
jgi:hypothetical protein